MQVRAKATLDKWATLCDSPEFCLNQPEPAAISGEIGIKHSALAGLPPEVQQDVIRDHVIKWATEKMTVGWEVIEP